MIMRVRQLYDVLVFALICLASGAFLQLARDGGARQQGLDNIVPYDGFLNWLLPLWLVVAGSFSIHEVLQRRLRPELERPTILALLLLMCLSVVWAEYPTSALRTSIGVVVSWLFLKSFIRRYGEEALFNAVTTSCVVIVFASLTYVFLLPNYGVSIDPDASGRWQGVFDQKNVLGNFAALTLILTTRVRKPGVKSSTFEKVGSLTALLLIVGSESATSLILGTVGVLLNWATRFRVPGGLIYYTRAAVAIILCVVAAGLVVLSMNYPVVDLADRDTSFTGRNLIWAYILMKVSASPLLGYGVDQLTPAIVNTNEFLSYVGFMVGSSHNGYLETLYYLGLIGLGILIASMISKLASMTKGVSFFRVYGIVVFVMLLNIVEARLVGFNLYFILLLTLLSRDVGRLTNVSR